MRDLPQLVRVAIAVQLCLSVLAAAFGTPPRRRVGPVARSLLFLGVTVAAFAAALLHARHHPLATKLVLAGCVELLCLWVWVRRSGPRRDDDDGGEWGDIEPLSPSPLIDWAAFDQARRGWDRRPTRR